MAMAAAATPMEILEATPAVFISQNISITELVTGCEMRNKYNIYAADPATRTKAEGYPLFKAKEDSTCYQRQCCGPSREFTMDFFQRHPTEENGRGPLLMRLDRPFKCCNLCCCDSLRSEMSITSGSGEPLGHVKNPCSCCNMLFDVGAPQGLAGKDGDSEQWYRLSGAICQLGMFCRCPCEPCKRVVFHILDQSGNKVGEVLHVFAGCVKEGLAGADNYVVVFPPKATGPQKASLMGTVILLDFLFFEQKNNNN